MKICVFGAGAVGGYVAARLLKSGKHQVSVVARGAQLRAIAASGIALSTPDEEFVVRPHFVTEDPQELGAQDAVFVTLKAHSQPAAARGIGSLMHQGSAAVFMNNGIPWWWNYRGDPRAAAPLPLLDPESALWTHVGPRRAIGCVVFSANEQVRPGVVRHSANNNWLLGEPDGRQSDRLTACVDALRDAGLNARHVPDIRDRIWAKLLRNAPLNSICALTRLPVHALARDPDLQGLCDSVIDEIAAIAAAHGTDLRGEVEAAKAAPRLGGALDGSPHASIRPSMLQDAVAGRTMEVDAILGQPQQFARDAGVPTVALDLLLPLLRGLSRSTGG